jgi:hypothetical protein
MFLEFEEESHKYFIPGIQKKFTSVTTIVSSLKQPFDAEKVAKTYAEKHGHTPEYWVEKWDKKRNDSCERGSTYHKMKEDLVYNCGVDNKGGRLYTTINWEQKLRMNTSHSELPDGVYLELRIWLFRLGISGTIDKVYITTEGKTRYVDIEDYKTNEKIDTESHKFRDGNYKMMRSPVSHLMDCNFNHYQLQLSLYGYILEQFGYTVRSLTLRHQGHEPFEGVGEPSLKPYICSYLKKEVKDIINTL